jgi:acyl carrier protein
MDIAALMLEVEEAYDKKIPGTKLHELNSINRLTDFINAV